MEEKASRAKLKRPFSPDRDDFDDDSNKPPSAKRVRFPKGKKVKPSEEKVDITKLEEDDDSSDKKTARLAAKERAMWRSQINEEIFSDENRGIIQDITAAEVHYEDNETFFDDGIKIEPFNLEQEREEGYFDAEGNFVEYITDDIKDAWADSLEVDEKLANKGSVAATSEDDIPDLTSQEIGKIKRRIADVLEPGETVLQALRRMKGASNNKKEKMSAETKVLFDQLTEDSMKLMENGDYDVYDEKQEVFQREAEGYERLAQARGEVDVARAGEGNSGSILGKDLTSNGMNNGGAASWLSQSSVGPSNLDMSNAEDSLNTVDDSFDMFGEDDENAATNPASSTSNLVPESNPNNLNQSSEIGAVQNDYMYDESSGYYYSSSLGYYYDPASGLYCCASSGKWYSYNEETGTYDEYQEGVTNAI